MADKLIIEYVPLELLKGWDRNPRKISKEELLKLQRSLESFGVVQPLQVRRSDNRIVGGHQRIKAMQAAGMTEAPVVYLDLSDAEYSRLNIALNRISGDWNTEVLLPLLEEIRSEAAAGGLAFELTGYTEVELTGLVSTASGGTEAAAVDAGGLIGDSSEDPYCCPKCGRPF